MLRLGLWFEGLKWVGSGTSTCGLHKLEVRKKRRRGEDFGVKRALWVQSFTRPVSVFLFRDGQQYNGAF
jgi:hypothetical protein